MNIRTISIALLMVAAIVGGYLLKSGLQPTATAVEEFRAATVLPQPIDLPEFELRDQDGNAVGSTSFLGQWHLMFFGFTHCPDICPATLQLLTAVKKRLEETGITASPRIVLVSVDPERDSEEVIGRYVSHFGDDTLGITGDLEELQKLTGELGIYFAKQFTNDDKSIYSVDHSSAVLVLNPHSQFHGLFSGTPGIDDYVHDLAKVLSTEPLVASNVSLLRAIPGSSMSVGYLTLSNTSTADIVIGAVSSAQFKSVQIHETLVQDGVASMRPVSELRIPAMSAVSLERGAFHLMLHEHLGDDQNVQLQMFTDDGTTLTISTSLQSRTE